MNRRAGEPRFRHLLAEDYAAVCALDEGTSGGNQAQPSTISLDAFVERVQAGCSYIAEIDDAPVAYLLAQPIAYLDSEPLTIWVEEIVVHPDWRRRGIASQLYQTFGRWARGKGVKAVLTRADPDNQAARALHQQVGFEPHSGETVIWRFEGA